MNRLEALLEMAKRDYKRLGHVAPVVYVEADGRTNAYPMAWESEQEKRHFFTEVAEAARAAQADAVSLLTAAWAGSPGHDPDTALPPDAIYALDISPSGAVEVAALRVVHTPGGVSFEPIEPDPSVKERAGLFPPWRTAH